MPPDEPQEANIPTRQDDRATYWTPRPDPTILTTEQSNRLRDEMRREIAMLREIIFTRFDAMDAAAKLLADHVNDCPSKTEIQKAFETRTVQVDGQLHSVNKLFDEKLGRSEERLRGLRDEFGEKFESIQNQFKERDVRTDQASIASSTAVNAALQAQKEAAGAQNESNAAAITKSEAATTKQIDAIQLNITSNIEALNDKISEIRGRLDRGEGVTRGGTEQRTEARSDRDSSMHLFMVLIGVAAIISPIVTGIFLHATAPALPQTPGTISYAPPTVVSPATVQPK